MLSVFFCSGMQFKIAGYIMMGSGITLKKLIVHQKQGKMA